jgi:chromosome partitioning protein
MTTILTIANQKGGVGKTTTAVNLGHGLALKGKSTLIIDLDPQGQVATSLGAEPEPGIYSWLIARQPLSSLVKNVREDLYIIPGDSTTAHVQTILAVMNEPIDFLIQKIRLITNHLKFIIFDTSPSVGGLQERALYAADLVIIPSECKFLAADSVARTIATIQANVEKGWSGALLGILPTFAQNTNESHHTLADLLELYPNQVLAPAIHQATLLAECAAAGRTIWEVDGESRAATEYAQILYRVMNYG